MENTNNNKRVSFGPNPIWIVVVVVVSLGFVTWAFKTNSARVKAAAAQTQAQPQVAR